MYIWIPTLRSGIILKGLPVFDSPTLGLIVLLWIIATHFDQIQDLWRFFQSIDDIEDDDDEDQLPLINDTERYCKQKLERWMQSFSMIASKWNVNIDPVFYDRALLKKVWESPHNALEAQWKRRMLFESTPRGNIVMHYDAYREGFVYYSDQSSLPYCILNAVAMKYVLLFRCRDFFIDESIGGTNASYPQDLSKGYETIEDAVPSPMIRMLREEERAEQDKKKQSMSHLLKHKDTSSGPSPFVQYRSKQPDAGTQPTSSVPPPPSPIKNKFVYLGKLHNWAPLLQSKKTNMTSSTKTVTQYEDLFSELNVDFVPILPSKESLNYKSYKHQLANV
jgi:hypothetical protein